LLASIISRGGSECVGTLRFSGGSGLAAEAFGDDRDHLEAAV